MLRALVAKAVLDRNANEMAAREPWAEIWNLRQDLGDEHWEGRAKAEIGQISLHGWGCPVGDHDAQRGDRFPIPAVGSWCGDSLHRDGRQWIR